MERLADVDRVLLVALVLADLSRKDIGEARLVRLRPLLEKLTGTDTSLFVERADKEDGWKL